ncbi:hypothetical protein BSKO_12884 [Bryopsis sp. KO-2023]|nr:hypothetical protein BSKO_12884 [Bryopsis sp. KO-2023]
MEILEQMKVLRDQLETEVEEAETKVADEEYEYLTSESSQLGNVLKGFEGFLSSKDTIRRKSRQQLKHEERLFSLSSKSSQITKEYEQQLLMEQTMEQIIPHGAPPKKVHPQKMLTQKRQGDKQYAKKASVEKRSV